jgi:hypothetical protein
MEKLLGHKTTFKRVICDIETTVCDGYISEKC